MAPPGVDKVADSSASNVRAGENARPGARKRASGFAAWASLTLLASALPLVAQTPASCTGHGAVRWNSLAPPGDRDILDRWCDSVGPPFVATGRTPPASIATLVVATWNVHAGNGDVERFVASLAQRPAVRAPFGVVLLLQSVPFGR